MNLFTERLIIRRLENSDAEFIVKLVNQDSWIKNIGDRHIYNLDDAIGYIQTGPVTMYNTYGFGLFAVQLKNTDMVIGICGVIKRDTLEDIDLGFAFLDEYAGQNYAYESSVAIINWVKNAFDYPQIAAIVNPENERSIKLLVRLGFSLIKQIKLPHSDSPLNFMNIVF